MAGEAYEQKSDRRSGAEEHQYLMSSITAVDTCKKDYRAMHNRLVQSSGCAANIGLPNTTYDLSYTILA